MQITDLSRADIAERIAQQPGPDSAKSEDVRILFVPDHITDQNFDQVCALYKQIANRDYDSVVVIETTRMPLEKKLSMSSHERFKTPLGEVKVDDKLRNDFCEEDDDFFINDAGFHEEMALFDHLMMLQTTLEDFSVLSLQIADEQPDIIRELAQGLSEVLMNKDVLVIFCCSMHGERQKEFEKLKNVLQKNDQSYLMNFLSRGGNVVEGIGSFVAGVMVTKQWDLDLNFINGSWSGPDSPNLISGFARYASR